MTTELGKIMFEGSCQLWSVFLDDLIFSGICEIYTCIITQKVMQRQCISHPIRERQRMEGQTHDIYYICHSNKDFTFSTLLGV